MTSRRLHLNEAAIAPSPSVVAAMQRALADANRYPDNDPAALTQALSRQTAIPGSRIVFGNGSSEVLVHAVQIAIRAAGDEAVIPVPSFPLYEKEVGLQGGRTVGVPTRPDGAPDVPAMLAAIGPRCRIVFAATPNNPTGALMSQDAVERLAAGVPDDVLLVLDEAYYEFGRHAGAKDNLAVLSRRKGAWIATRTFSKAHALAGLRLGYGLTGTARLADEFRRRRANFHVNHIAQSGALAALADDAYVHALLDANARERSRLIMGLQDLGLEPLPSATNFVTMPLPRAAAEIVEGLGAQGILAMALQWPGMPHGLRISVGTADDTAAVLAALATLLRPRTWPGFGRPSAHSAEVISFAAK